ncbi:MAG TPA: response regulator transcription factor [Candidatus Acidoferrum sp.]|jgi:DNA-binding NarL/FixJ family response regulator
MGSVKILIADDHSSVRALLRNILETVPHWSVCGEAENGRSAVSLAQELGPDIMIMDLVMPGMSGLEATRRVLQFNTKTRIILTTLHDFPSFVEEARKAGACGCFFKSESGRHAIPAVQAAMKRKEFFTSEDLEGTDPQ